MRGGSRMGAGVAGGGRIAAERHPTGLTPSQVDPARLDLDALLALAACGMLDGRDRFDVRTCGVGHREGSSMLSTDARTDWPELQLADWIETRDALHLWLQIVGKV